MSLLEVIPLKKGLLRESLTYFSSLDVEVGDIVEIPLRKSKVKALVIAIRDAREAKHELRSSDFALRKVEKVLKGERIVSPSLLKAVERTSEYYAGNTGSILGAIWSDQMMEMAEASAKPDSKNESATQEEYSKTAMEGDDEERMSSLRSIIRQNFARKCSIMIIVPTALDGEYIKAKLEKGIEEYTLLLHSKLTKKEVATLKTKLADYTHPYLILATPTFIALTRSDTREIIIERANSRNFRLRERPYLDWKRLIEYFCEEAGKSLTYSDITLPIEILAGVYDGEINKGEPMRSRVFSNSDAKVIDTSGLKTEIFSPELIDLIKEASENNENLALFTGRKGLFPQTVCGDCGKSVLCIKCHYPLVLYPSRIEKDAYYFMCNRCGERYASDIKCNACNSWKLTTLGIGVELVERRVREILPEAKILRIDADSTPKEKDARKVIAELEKYPGSILIATEMALRFMKERIASSAVISLDSLASLPDFRAGERLFYLLSSIRARTTRRMIVQTRLADMDCFREFPSGNILEFSRAELAGRQSVNFPPYSIIIKITIKGERDEVIEKMKSTQEALHPSEVDVFPSFTYGIKGEYILHGVLKVTPKSWPDRELLSKIRSLSPDIEIRVDPENLL